MKRFIFWLVLPVAGLASSCAVALLKPITPPQFAQGGTSMQVVGLTDLSPGQSIYFGDYRFGRVRRGWTHTRFYPQGWAVPGAAAGPGQVLLWNNPAYLQTRDSRNNLSFSLQQGPRRATVVCTNYVVAREVTNRTPVANGWTITTGWQNTFYGSITGPRIGTQSQWEVLLGASDRTTGFGRPAGADAQLVGLVGSRDSVLLEVREVVRHSVPHPKTHQPVALPMPMCIGYELVLRHGPAIGFVDLQQPQPRIWLRDNLPEELRFLTANAAATVMFWARG